MDYSTAVKINIKMDIRIKEIEPYRITVFLRAQDPIFKERLQRLLVKSYFRYYFRRRIMPFVLVHKRFYFSQMIYQPDGSFSLEDMLNESGDIFDFENQNDARHFSEEVKEFLYKELDRLWKEYSLLVQEKENLDKGMNETTIEIEHLKRYS